MRGACARPVALTRSVTCERCSEPDRSEADARPAPSDVREHDDDQDVEDQPPEAHEAHNLERPHGPTLLHVRRRIHGPLRKINDVWHEPGVPRRRERTVGAGRSRERQEGRDACPRLRPPRGKRSPTPRAAFSVGRATPAFETELVAGSLQSMRGGQRERGLLLRSVQDAAGAGLAGARSHTLTAGRTMSTEGERPKAATSVDEWAVLGSNQ